MLGNPRWFKRRKYTGWVLNVNYLCRFATIIFAGSPQKNYLSSSFAVKLIVLCLAVAAL